MIAAENCFIGKDKMKRGKAKSSTHIRRRGQNDVTKLPGVIGQGTPLRHLKHGTVSLQMKFQTTLFITRISVFLLSNLTSAAKEMPKLTDKTELKAFVGLPYLAGALRSNKQNLEELCGADGDGVETFRLVMNQRRFEFLIRCI
jgi:hypothetical protein